MMPVTEIGEALHLIRTGIHQVIPHTYGLLSSAIYTEPAVFGPLSFNLSKPGTSRHGAMIGFNNYPARPRVGMFNRLLSASYCLVMTHSFRFKSAGGAVSALRLISQQMRNAGDAADDLVEGLQEAANQTASLKTATGRHHFSLAVYAERPEDLDSIVADASKTLSHFGGAAPIREMNLWYNGAMEASVLRAVSRLANLQGPAGRYLDARPRRHGVPRQLPDWRKLWLLGGLPHPVQDQRSDRIRLRHARRGRGPHYDDRAYWLR